jgi:hypothetical protein
MLNIEQLYPVVSQLFKVRLKFQLALMFNYGSYEISLFNSGCMLIKGVTDEEHVLSIYWKVLEKVWPVYQLFKNYGCIECVSTG